MRQEENDPLELMVKRLRRIQQEIDAMNELFIAEKNLRNEIKEYMVENNCKKAIFDDTSVSIAHRRSTLILDHDQIVRSLIGRGRLEECLVLDATKVRDILGDDALGMETTSKPYLIVK